MKDVIIAVHESETTEYVKSLDPAWVSAGIRVLPYGYENLAEKRSLVIMTMVEENVDKYCLIDDDLVFLIRRDATGFSMRNQEEADTLAMFDYIDRLLDTYPHGAISPREGNNRVGNGTREQLDREITRAMRFHFFRTKECLEMEHSRVKDLEDFDFTLQMLKAGYKNVVPYWYSQGQGKTQAAGGCSVYRTHKVHEDAANLLVQLHPGLVTKRLKQNKTDADGFGTRTEVTVQWKKAYKSSGRR